MIVTHGSYNIPEPYFPPRTKEGRGTGFLITREGHVITNAHVVGSMINMTFRSENAGNRNLPIELIAVCPAKDVALLKIPDEILPELGEFEPMVFGDDNKLEQTQAVIAIGYPLGRERIKFTAGVVSGYESPESEDGSESQSYIQVDAAINPGNSGGPLVNQDGQVVGINSAGIPSFMAQNTNFAIPSRVVLSIMREMFSMMDVPEQIVRPPMLGLAFHKVTKYHFEAMGIKDELYQHGLRVREVIPGSPFLDTSDGDIKVGDIVQIIEFADPYNDPGAFDIASYRDQVCRRCNAEVDTYIEINRYGNIKLMKRSSDRDEYEESSYTKTRKVTLQDVVDTIPVDTRLTLQVVRNVPSDSRTPQTSFGEITAPFRNPYLPAIKHIYPPFDKLDYVLFAGCVWIEISANIIDHMGDNPNLCDYVSYSNRKKPRVMISKILAPSDAYDLEALEVTDVLESVNGIKVFDLDTLRYTLSGKFPYVKIMTTSGKEAVFSKQVAAQQDEHIRELMNITR